MQVTDTDVLAMVIGAVSIIFSGFVLAYSAWGGVAVFVGGALAISISLLRERVAALTPIVWLVFVALVVGGLLVGFGVFDSPAIQHDADATLHDNGTYSATVLVTGTVQNVGDGAAEEIVLTVTLRTDDGRQLRIDETRLNDVRPGTSQQFFVRFGPDSDLSAFRTYDIDVGFE